MKKYKLELEVTIECPTDSQHPELTITLREILRSLKDGSYAVCGDHPRKLTASMHITKTKIVPSVCGECGHSYAEGES